MGENKDTRDARPLNPEALSHLLDAIEEEFDQGKYIYALITLFALVTGARKRLVKHYVDDWREEGKSSMQITTPKETKCTVAEDGCYKCNGSQTGGPDGILRPKTGQSRQRTFPVPDYVEDLHKGERREVKLNERLDKWFSVNDTFGYTSNSHLVDIVKKVATRREDEIAEEFEGYTEAPKKILGEGRRICLDIHFHDLRATWATHLIRIDVKQETIMDWLGWENPGMYHDYRSFVGDPTGDEVAKVEGRSDENNVVTNSDGKDVLQALQAADISDEQMAQIVENL